MPHFWNWFRCPDFGKEEPTEETVTTVLQKIELRRIFAAGQNDWTLDEDLKLAEDLIKVLWTERQKMKWQLEHGISRIQKPD